MVLLQDYVLLAMALTLHLAWMRYGYRAADPAKQLLAWRGHAFSLCLMLAVAVDTSIRDYVATGIPSVTTAWACVLAGMFPILAEVAFTARKRLQAA